MLAVRNLILHTHFSCLPLLAGLSLIAPAFAPDLSSYSEYRVLKNVECNHYKHNNTYMSVLLEQPISHTNMFCITGIYGSKQAESEGVA